MNGDDMLALLEAKRAEIDTAISNLRQVLLVLHGPAVPDDPVQLRPRRPDLRRAHRGPRHPQAPAALADRIVAWLAKQDAPAAMPDILEQVRGSKRDYVIGLVKAGRLAATGQTTARRYTVAKVNGDALLEHLDLMPAVVWNGGPGLSSYQQKARG